MKVAHVKILTAKVYIVPSKWTKWRVTTKTISYADFSDVMNAVGTRAAQMRSVYDLV